MAAWIGAVVGDGGARREAYEESEIFLLLYDVDPSCQFGEPPRSPCHPFPGAVKEHQGTVARGAFAFPLVPTLLASENLILNIESFVAITTIRVLVLFLFFFKKCALSLSSKESISCSRDSVVNEISVYVCVCARTHTRACLYMCNFLFLFYHSRTIRL